MKHEDRYKKITGRPAYGLDNNGIVQYYSSYLKFVIQQAKEELETFKTEEKWTKEH